MDYLSTLPVEIFIQNITYLPFSEVTKVCGLNQKLHNYCTDDKYKYYWKTLIDNTFGSVYNYDDKLRKIWKKLNIPGNTYNYVVYTKFVELLDPITQLMIYHRQNDQESFNDPKFNNEQKFIAMFLLGERGLITKYLPHPADFDGDQGFPYYLFVYVMENKNKNQEYLNRLMVIMATYNSVAGVKYFINKGAEPYAYFGKGLVLASQKGNTEVVKYLLEQRVDPDSDNGYALELASNNGHLDTVKVLVEHGADVHINNDNPIKFAEKYGHHDIVAYLKSQ